jgi:hypothetical protein
MGQAAGQLAVDAPVTQPVKGIFSVDYYRIELTLNGPDWAFLFASEGVRYAPTAPGPKPHAVMTRLSRRR